MRLNLFLCMNLVNTCVYIHTRMYAHDINCHAGYYCLRYWCPLARSCEVIKSLLDGEKLRILHIDTYIYRIYIIASYPFRAFKITRLNFVSCQTELLNQTCSGLVQSLAIMKMDHMLKPNTKLLTQTCLYESSNHSSDWYNFKEI